MKYIFLIIIAFLIVQEIPAQVRLSTMDSATTFIDTDLFWLNTKPTSAFVNRKASWRTLRYNIENFMADSTHTWALKQTFSSGATFSAGSNGGVTFADSVVFNAYIYSLLMLPVNDNSWVGSQSFPYNYIYSRNFVIPNTEENDSVYINYDDSTLSINKKLTVSTLNVTGDLVVPDSTQFNGIALSQTIYQPSFVTDSIITIAGVVSSILLSPPGSMGSPGIEKINIPKAGDGQLLVITNRIAVTVVFQDSEADGNLYLATDFSMGQWYSLTLMYNSNISKWIELSRSSN